jgi:flavin-dependent thymidylate synthase
MSNELERWADPAMYHSEEMPEEAKQGPRVHLLGMTADPLGVIAAGAMMYEGRVARSLADVTHEDRQHYAAEILKTHLKAPLELVNLHFMIEGVSRSFTHQMVRQRTAVFMQESLRFAVKENLDEETPLPPSLADKPDDDPQVRLWRGAINRVQDTYEALVSAGMPAEDARGLLPHQTTTRLHYKTDLRNLRETLGNRLCTQAQFEWRAVAIGMVDAIRSYRTSAAQIQSMRTVTNPDQYVISVLEYMDGVDAWQYEAISQMFRPICYLTGKCEFKASFDRACSIRERVTANADKGRGSSSWDRAYIAPAAEGMRTDKDVVHDERGPIFIGSIHPAEWLADPTAARRAE